MTASDDDERARELFADYVASLEAVMRTPGAPPPPETGTKPG